MASSCVPIIACSAATGRETQIGHCIGYRRTVDPAHISSKVPVIRKDTHTACRQYRCVRRHRIVNPTTVHNPHTSHKRPRIPWQTITISSVLSIGIAEIRAVVNCTIASRIVGIPGEPGSAVATAESVVYASRTDDLRAVEDTASRIPVVFGLAVAG